MLITLMTNQTVLDFSTMINGNYDSIVKMMIDNNIDSLDSNLAGQTFDIIYNTTNSLVNSLFINGQQISTGDQTTFNDLATQSTLGAFNPSEYNIDFDITI